ncbi:RloB family protein [Ramlibacter sp. AN1015]|uniref:RloB family protein n=1 Tax=Ramlibacter sp. AN1015 TaxID=3133428 RepID=UPI0030C3AD3D
MLSRSSAAVEFAHCGRTDPLGIVESAVRRSSGYERVYCVIDRDSHANFDEAIAAAAGHAKVSVLASYPCFEYWLLLHFGYTRAPFQRAGNNSAADCVIQELRRKVGMTEYSKGGTKDLFRLLLDRLPEARTRAEQSLRDAEADGEKNPSTPLHRLIDTLEELGGPLPIL